MAGDDENGGAASVTEGAAATAVLGVGEEDGEVRHGVRDPLVGLAGGGVVGDERREAAAFGTPVRKLRLRRDPKQEGVGYGYCEAKRDGEIDRGGPGRYIGEGRGLGVDG